MIYTYDRAGNRTGVQTDDRREIYSYDRGRLRNWMVERQQDPAGSQTYTYRYDAEGLRSQMEENGKLVSFIYADREVIAEEDEAGEHIRYIRGHELLASDSERARTYYHYACDEMGSITDITDCHGTVLNHYAYDAFGNRIVEEETVENRFGFAGELLDAVTGQYYLRARFYNSVRYVDPSGHEGLICSMKYGELKKKEAEGGTLSEKEKRQIYEYEQNQKKSNGAGSDSKTIKNVEAPILPEGSSWERNVLNSFAGGKSNSVTYGGGTTLYNEIRYSQSSVNGSNDIIQSMRESGWKGEPIDVVEMPDGIYTTIDNKESKFGGVDKMSLEEQFIKRNGELQQKVKEEIEKVKEGQSERNIVQLQTILSELQTSSRQKNIILSYPRIIIDTWDYSDYLGMELVELAELYKKI